ncbi:hypothetical protein MnTg02_00161 [bacterium MnTg02]|nr:hypothetical protein MnTg02_00161 [bacterium MnTg02]
MPPRGLGIMDRGGLRSRPFQQMGSQMQRALWLAILLSVTLFAPFALGQVSFRTAGIDERLVAKGREIFFNETFGGNGRTCGTCHREEDNFTITPGFIATLPPHDPLFVAETNPALRRNFENPKLMREFGLILENLDGFDDLQNRFVMRGVPHVLGLRTSVASRDGSRTGWSGDGAPGDRSLRSFATGAVTQHFPRTLKRIAGVDFRLPNDAELDALEAFMLSLGRQRDLALPLELKGTVARRGQEIFRDNTLGKCNICHFNAGANADPAIFGPNAGNLNFNTGVEGLPDQPARLTGERVPRDDGLGTPGDETFNTPSLVEAADSGPFFHNNSIQTIEGSVSFYNGDSFNNSPAGQVLANATGSGINLDATQVVAVAAFLRVINALENITETIALLEQALIPNPGAGNDKVRLALEETNDTIRVLQGGALHPVAVNFLQEARNSTTSARRRGAARQRLIQRAIRIQRMAREELIEFKSRSVEPAQLQGKESGSKQVMRAEPVFGQKATERFIPTVDKRRENAKRVKVAPSRGNQTAVRLLVPLAATTAEADCKRSVTVKSENKISCRSACRAAIREWSLETSGRYGSGWANWDNASRKWTDCKRPPGIFEYCVAKGAPCNPKT